MAQQVTVRKIDDVDGTEAAETLQFGLDGVAYNIDLSAEHAAELRAAVGQWIEHARRVKRTNGSGTSAPRRRSDNGESRAIREWAATQGISLSPRGRIPTHVIERWQRQHQPAA